MATAVPTRGLVPNASLPAKVQPIPPNQTLYVTNLPSSKIQKADLRTALYLLFSTYGPVLDVVALKTMSMRGQAHIVYRDVQTATQAMRSLEGQEFLGRQLKIQYAKSKSHFVSKLDGTFKMPSASGAAVVEQTQLQQSIFNAPPPGSVAPAKPPAAVDQVMNDAGTPESRGQKRGREDEDEGEDSESDVAMEEDSDDE
ncbi:U2 small nuclear ribonucleoprotein B'' [Metarhizium anisopliae]|uniref:Nucleotide-binding, alpha-beta plait n=2 Tax=Metarhizium robertsii TaxID=568076 RepID=E9EVR2_METRA|nr:Nucleotide-binding, alpha-beta plait [Metarhizium robertsii ARSEF 23]EFZ00334.2 Nucleotide-binding, alpha-beta plait [Metarhizium robertsii ARSEF 23]EXV02804.1 RNA recognition motif (RRM) superfamily protein [Metarhizium robertsii]KAF5125602.1 U2 small nuclear ribonucleoprotein B'' [Metarhizium anisopliae]